MATRARLESSGWFAGAEKIVSPNFDARPEGVKIELIVLHAISLPPGEFGGGYIDQLFQNQLSPAKHPYFRSIVDLKVSAHLLVERTGELKQFVSTDCRAWHCGVSEFAGRAACNDFSIGVELEGCNELPFANAQYEVLTDVLAELSLRYPAISPTRIVGHCDIAPGRKTDPGPLFEWETMRCLLQEKFTAHAGEKSE